MKYSSEQEREEKRFEALERPKVKAKKKREERKRDEKIQTVREWYEQSQRDLKKDYGKNV